MPSDATIAVDPVEDLTSNDMACGINGEKGVARVCPISGGSTLTFEFRQWPDDYSRGALDVGHKGPCAVYAKKVESAVSDGATGAGWFKIWDEGYDESSGKWCTEKMIDNNGRLSIVVPDSLQGGDYLIRSELIALHNANLSPPDPQFYVGCAQVYLQSSGSLVPAASDTVSIPGYVSIDESSVTYDIYAQPLALPYPVPGPKAFSTTSSGVSHVASTADKQTDGLVPAHAIVRNANWYGIELDKYSTEDACWAQSKLCWDQVDDCYAKAPPTGSSGCKLMEGKCTNVDDQCTARNFDGPPDYNKVLTPDAETISIPAAVNAGAANLVASSDNAETSIATSSGAVSTTSAVATSSATSPSTSSVVAVSSSHSDVTSASSTADYTQVASSSSDPAYTQAPSSSSNAAVVPSSIVHTTLRTSAKASNPVVTSSAYYDRQHNQDYNYNKVSTVTENDYDIVTVSETDIVTVEVTIYATPTAAPLAKKAANHGHFGHRRFHKSAPEA